MPPLHFSLRFVQFLADHRDPVLTGMFVGASALAGAPIYVLIILAIYVTWDKVLAVRLSFLALLTMSANDLLKNLIRNPRPFVANGAYQQKWAVSAARKQALAAEYSTPSGHAMGSASFYGYLATVVKKRGFRIGAGGLVLLIGFSRPYLGVHYGEDVLIGWGIGLLLALFAARYGDAIAARWRSCPYGLQIALAVTVSLALCVVSAAFNHWSISGSVNSAVLYTGFLTGNVIAFPLELRFVRFCATAGTVAMKLLRLLLTILMTVAVLLGLQFLDAAIATPASAAWLILDYLRYTTAGVAGLFVAPLVFTRLKLAERMDDAATLA